MSLIDMDVLGIWMAVLSRPKVTFKKEIASADRNAILLQLIFLSLGMAIISSVLPLLQSGTAAFSDNPFFRVAGQAFFIYYLIFLIVSIVLYFLLFLILYAVLNGIHFGLAKAFGGKGTFTQQLYLYCLFSVPLTLINSIFGHLPSLAQIPAVILTSIYSVFLLVRSLQAVHKLTLMKAAAVALITLLGLALLILAFIPQLALDYWSIPA